MFRHFTEHIIRVVVVVIVAVVDDDDVVHRGYRSKWIYPRFMLVYFHFIHNEGTILLANSFIVSVKSILVWESASCRPMY